MRAIIEKQQTRIAESESYLDAAVKQKTDAKTEVVKLKSELNRYKDEIDKYKKGQSNLTMKKSGNERLKAEVENL